MIQSNKSDKKLINKKKQNSDSLVLLIFSRLACCKYTAFETFNFQKYVQISYGPQSVIIKITGEPS